MKRFQFHDTPNSQPIWQITNCVSGYADVLSFFGIAQL